MARYQEFEQHVTTRLSPRLDRPEGVDAWIDERTRQILDKADSLGPKLHELFAQELYDGTPEAERLAIRIRAQEEMISAWWEETMGFPAFDGAIRALILLFQGAELHVAHGHGSRRRLGDAIAFVLRSAVDRYAGDPSLAGFPRTVERLVAEIRERE